MAPKLPDRADREGRNPTKPPLLGALFVPRCHCATLLSPKRDRFHLVHREGHRVHPGAAPNRWDGRLSLGRPRQEPLHERPLRKYEDEHHGRDREQYSKSDLGTEHGQVLPTCRGVEGRRAGQQVLEPH